MSSRVDRELSRVMVAMSETAPTRPDLTTWQETKLTRRRSTVLRVAGVFALALGLLGTVAVVNGRDTSPPMVLAMNNSGGATVVGTFPRLLIEGWTLTAVTEGIDSVDYQYEDGSARAAIHIEFGDQDALNRAYAAAEASLTDPFVVTIDEFDDQQVAFFGYDESPDHVAVWGDAGRVFELQMSEVGSLNEALTTWEAITVVDEAGWEEATPNA